MRPKLWIFGLLFILLLPLTARARLGETLEECIARYGKPVKVNPGNSPEARKIAAGYEFKKNNLRITCVIYSDTGTCCTVFYKNWDNSKMARDDQYRILGAIEEPGNWRPMEDQDGKAWTSEKTGNVAILKEASIVIVSRDKLKEGQGLGGL